MMFKRKKEKNCSRTLFFQREERKEVYVAKYKEGERPFMSNDDDEREKK